MGTLINLIGQKFGKLTVVERYGCNESKKQPKWKCICDCGKVKYVMGCELRSGNTKSCGCNKGNHGTHRLSRTIEYTTWVTMKYRCTKQSEDHKDYFDRGIIVCDRWVHSFENFFEDMGKRPSNKHSLDRFPNNDGNYEPENCRWATQKEQAGNKRNNRIIEYNGESKILTDWCILFKATSANVNEMLKYQTFGEVYNFYMNGKKRRKRRNLSKPNSFIIDSVNY